MKYTFLFYFCLCFTTWAQHPAISDAQLVFPPQNEHVHGNSHVRLPNGDYLMVWFQGSGERKSDDVRLMGARLRAGSKTWSAPFLMADTPGIPDCNPVLFFNSSGTLFLVWIAVQANQWEQSLLRFKTSRDFLQPGPPKWNWQDNILLKPGEEFAEEVQKKWKDLPPSGSGWAGYAPSYDAMIQEASRDASKRSWGWMTRIKPLILAQGRILLPLYSDGLNMGLMAISDDDGQSWKPSLPLVGRGPIQPSLTLNKDGSILALCRDSGDDPARVQRSVSKDQGMTWSAAEKTDIPNTASVESLVLNDGRLAMVLNDNSDGRYRLSLWISADEGLTWTWKIPIEQTEKGRGSFSYPSLSQDPQGMLHVSYSAHHSNNQKSIKYLCIDPKKIKP